jgi:DNA polymerase-3 subunit delta'
MNFCDFIGNEQLKHDFLESFINYSTGQSYLIEGATGSGKRTFGTLMAKSFLCHAPTREGPCGICGSCQKVEEGIHPDLTVIMPEKEKTSVSVDVVRSLRETLYILPNDAEKKVYLIADAEGLTVAAQNALLKAFEEPPPFAVFILTAKNSQSLLPTIRSRAIRFKTSLVSREQIAAFLKKRGKVSEQEISDAVNLCGGSIGMAQNLLKSKFMEEVGAFLEGYTQTLSGTDRAAYLSYGSFFEKNKGNITMILGLLQLWIRDILILKEGGASQNLFFVGRAEAIAQRAHIFTRRGLLALWQIIQKTIDVLNSNGNFSSALIVMQINSWEEIH